MSAQAPAPVGRVIGRLTGLLRVTVHGARDLASKQLIGTMDPYISARLKSETLKSSVHKNGGRMPRWDHTFVFNLKEYDEHEILHFEVMNKEMLSDDTIGLASIELKDIVTFHNVRRWYQLVHKHNFSHIAGAFEATIDYSGTGVEWFVQAQPVAAAATVQPVYAAPAAAPAPAQPAPVSYQPPAAAPPAQYAQQPAPAAYQAAPAPAPAPAPYGAPYQPAPAGYPAPAPAPMPYGYPPQPQPQPYYGAPPQPYGAPQPYYPPAAAQPYYPPAQPVYGQPPTVIYGQPQPQVVEIIEQPAMGYNPGLAMEAAILRAEEREIRREEREIRREEFFGGGGYY